MSESAAKKLLSDELIEERREEQRRENEQDAAKRLPEPSVPHEKGAGGTASAARTQIHTDYGDGFPDLEPAGPAAYTPPVGMKSLERKLMQNGDGTHLDPEWSEVRVVMRERNALLTAVEGLLDVGERSRSGDPSLDPEEWYAIRDYARKVLNDAAA